MISARGNPCLNGQKEESTGKSLLNNKNLKEEK